MNPMEEEEDVRWLPVYFPRPLKLKEINTERLTEWTDINIKSCTELNKSYENLKDFATFIRIKRVSFMLCPFLQNNSQ